MKLKNSSKRYFFGVFLVFSSWSCTKTSAEYTFNLALVTPADHPHTIASRKFADLVEDGSKGKIVIRVFDSASLGSNPELLDGIHMGIIDFAISTPSILAEFDPTPGIFGLPYLFKNIEHMLSVTRGNIGTQIKKIYQRNTGIKILSYAGGSQRHMISKSPIRSIKDLEGQQMRTMEWEVSVQWWKALGANPTVLPFNEVYTALQTGVVDGGENEFPSFTINRWAEPAKYIALTRHIIAVRPLIMNGKKFNSLPSGLQTVVQNAANEAADYDIQLETSVEFELKQQLEDDFGVEFIELNIEPFIERSLPVINSFGKDSDLDVFIDQIVDLGTQF